MNRSNGSFLKMSIAFAGYSFQHYHRYLWLYIIVLKSFLVYVSDIFTATTMLTTSDWHQQFAAECAGRPGCYEIPAHITKWLFIACILLSFALVCISPIYFICESHTPLNSWHTRLVRRRKLSLVETFRMRLRTSWPIITTL